MKEDDRKCLSRGFSIYHDGQPLSWTDFIEGLVNDNLVRPACYSCNAVACVWLSPPSSGASAIFKRDICFICIFQIWVNHDGRLPQVRIVFGTSAMLCSTRTCFRTVALCLISGKADSRNASISSRYFGLFDVLIWCSKQVSGLHDNPLLDTMLWPCLVTVAVQVILQWVTANDFVASCSELLQLCGKAGRRGRDTCGNVVRSILLCSFTRKARKKSGLRNVTLYVYEWDGLRTHDSCPFGHVRCLLEGILLCRKKFLWWIWASHQVLIHISSHLTASSWICWANTRFQRSVLCSPGLSNIFVHCLKLHTISIVQNCRRRCHFADLLTRVPEIVLFFIQCLTTDSRSLALELKLQFRRTVHVLIVGQLASWLYFPGQMFYEL